MVVGGVNVFAARSRELFDDRLLVFNRRCVVSNALGVIANALGVVADMLGVVAIRSCLLPKKFSRASRPVTRALRAADVRFEPLESRSRFSERLCSERCEPSVKQCELSVF